VIGVDIIVGEVILSVLAKDLGRGEAIL